MSMDMYMENTVAFILSICYGIRPDTAVRMTECAGKRLEQKKIINREISKFFDEKFILKKRVFLDYSERGMKVKDIAKKYDIDQLTVRRYLDNCECFYLEFKGLIELGMVNGHDNPQLASFLRLYGKYYVREERRKAENYKWYQEYLSGNISKTRLIRTTHMTPRTSHL